MTETSHDYGGTLYSVKANEVVAAIQYKGFI